MAAIAITTRPQPGRRAPLGSGSRPVRRHQPSVVVRRQRAAIITLVVLAALGILLGAGSLAGAGQAPDRSHSVEAGSDPALIAVTTHVVQPGDTLWTLARRVQPEGDIRPLVARLQAARGAGPLLPGERVRLAV